MTYILGDPHTMSVLLAPDPLQRQVGIEWGGIGLYGQGSDMLSFGSKSAANAFERKRRAFRDPSGKQTSYQLIPISTDQQRQWSVDIGL